MEMFIWCNQRIPNCASYLFVAENAYKITRTIVSIDRSILLVTSIYFTFQIEQRLEPTINKM